MNNSITWKKALFGSLLAIIILIASQMLALLFGKILTMLKCPKVIVGILSACTYPLLTFCGLGLTIERLLKIPLSALRFSKFKINLTGGMIGILLPAIVVITYLFIPGEWSELEVPANQKIAIALTGICFYSIAAGIVEEMVFRGVIMGLLEKWSNIKIAIIVPSVLFGLMHVLNGKLNLLSFIQLLLAGTVVSILFSLVAYHYNSFWNNALIHALWNASTIGVIHIGTESYENSVFTYVLKSKSFLITGGNFGIEASVISTSAYVFFILIITYRIIRKRLNMKTAT